MIDKPFYYALIPKDDSPKNLILLRNSLSWSLKIFIVYIAIKNNKERTLQNMMKMFFFIKFYLEILINLYDKNMKIFITEKILFGETK